MQPLGRARMLALAIAAAAIAAAGVASSSASSPPHPARGTLPHVSSGVPYVAPWQTGFERYSTQLLQMKAQANNLRTLVVPQGQWWRVIYANAELFTSAVVSNRIMRFVVLGPDLVQVYQQAATAPQAASSNGYFLFGPNLSAYSSMLAGSLGGAVQSIPDLLWPPGSTIELFVIPFQAGDAFNDPTTLGVEVYTPVKERPGVFVPTPAIA